MKIKYRQTLSDLEIPSTNIFDSTFLLKASIHSYVGALVPLKLAMHLSVQFSFCRRMTVFISRLFCNGVIAVGSLTSYKDNYVSNIMYYVLGSRLTLL